MSDNLMNELPYLSREEMSMLNNIRNNNFQEFNQNKLEYFLGVMAEYISKRQVFRISIMGQTRKGKSEIGSTIALWGTNIYNKLLAKGTFDDWDLFVKNKFKKEPNKFTVDFVCANQMDYNQKLRGRLKEDKLNIQQFWQIDEEKESTGGIGSISEMIETANLNNIIAKVCQHEIWIRPIGLQARNTVFGLHAFKKDMKNKVNWCLTYEVGTEPSGASIYRFIGWVPFPLHNNTEFREAYNDKKDDWILNEIKGQVDPRMMARTKASEYLVEKYSNFFTLNESGKNFTVPKGEQMVLVNRCIMKNEIHNFNESEKYMILEEARVIAKERSSYEH